MNNINNKSLEELLNETPVNTIRLDDISERDFKDAMLSARTGESAKNFGENRRYLELHKLLKSLPKIDIMDNVSVNARIDEYLELCYEMDKKPTISGMALSLGVTKEDLTTIKLGNYTKKKRIQNLPEEIKESIRKAHVLLESLWESYMLDGKISPQAGAFLAKNNFGYRDQVDYVVTPGDSQGLQSREQLDKLANELLELEEQRSGN